MASGQKKKDFFNRGKRFNSSECNPENEYLLPVESATGYSAGSSHYSYGVLSPPPLEDMQGYPISSSPPPLCPISELDSLSYDDSFDPYSASSYPPASTTDYPVAGASYESTEYGASCSDPYSYRDSYQRAQGESYRSSTSYPNDDPQDSPSLEDSNTLDDLPPSSSKPRRQKCSLCFNHGIITEKKGHKWQCPYRECECECCVITKGRQKTMKDQQKLTRDLIKMRLNRN